MRLVFGSDLNKSGGVHKYIKKERVNGKWVYTYTNEKIATTPSGHAVSSGGDFLQTSDETAPHVYNVGHVQSNAGWSSKDHHAAALMHNKMATITYNAFSKARLSKDENLRSQSQAFDTAFRHHLNVVKVHQALANALGKEEKSKKEADKTARAKQKVDRPKTTKKAYDFNDPPKLTPLEHRVLSAIHKNAAYQYENDEDENTHGQLGIAYMDAENVRGSVDSPRQLSAIASSLTKKGILNGQDMRYGIRNLDDGENSQDVYTAIGEHKVKELLDANDPAKKGKAMKAVRLVFGSDITKSGGVHKYVKKERINGKWVYTYPDDTASASPSKPAAKDAEESAQLAPVFDAIFDKFKNSDLLNKAMKLMDSDINKAEGARGGHVIGHTKSGKPVYESNGGEKAWGKTKGTTQGHLDAAANHSATAEGHRFDAAEHRKRGDEESAKNSDKLGSKYQKMADKHKRDVHDIRQENQGKKVIAVGASGKRYFGKSINKGQKTVKKAILCQHCNIRLEKGYLLSGIADIAKAWGHKVGQEIQSTLLKRNKKWGCDHKHAKRRGIRKAIECPECNGDMSLSDAIKAVGLDKLVKSSGKGEGTKGGHIIGHTKSGKPIYEAHANPKYKKTDAAFLTAIKSGHASMKKQFKDYSSDDHREAALAHDIHASKLHREGKKEASNDAMAAAFQHRSTHEAMDSKVSSGHMSEAMNHFHQAASKKGAERDFHVTAMKEHWDKAKKSFDDAENDIIKSAKKGEGAKGGHVIGHTKSGKPIYEAGHAHYTKPEKRRGFNGAMSPTQGHGDGHSMVRERFRSEGYDKQDHLDAAEAHKKASESMENKHSKLKDKAEIAAHGKVRSFLDRPNISGGVDESYPAKTNDKLRTLAQIGSKHSAISSLHEKASKNIRKSDDDTNIIKSAKKGEGSHGGHVIGHTKSGKAIYEKSGTGKLKSNDNHKYDLKTGDHEHNIKAVRDAHSNFSSEDHNAAAKKHLMARDLSLPDSAVQKKHHDLAVAHSFVSQEKAVNEPYKHSVSSGKGKPRKSATDAVKSETNVVMPLFPVSDISPKQSSSIVWDTTSGFDEQVAQRVAKGQVVLAPSVPLKPSLNFDHIRRD